MIGALSLRRKSLILVFMPLACLVVFVATLAFLLTTVKQEVGKESHSRDVILATSRALKKSYHLVYDKDITGEISIDTPLEERKRHAAYTEKEFVGSWKPVFELVAEDTYNQAEFAALRSAVGKSNESLKEWLIEMTKETPDKTKVHDMAEHVIDKTQLAVKTLTAISDLEEARSKENNSSDSIAKVKRIFLQLWLSQRSLQSCWHGFSRPVCASRWKRSQKTVSCFPKESASCHAFPEMTSWESLIGSFTLSLNRFIRRSNTSKHY